MINSPSPGIGTADASSIGSPTMYLLEQLNSSPYTQTLKPVTYFADPAENGHLVMNLVQVNLTRQNKTAFFIMYGTGMRYSFTNGSVNIKAYRPPQAGTPLTSADEIPELKVRWVGGYNDAQGEVYGSDQINLEISPAMAGKGKVRFVLGAPDSRIPGVIRCTNTVIANFQ